ncbi:MAG TPA: FtsX-like permease family protein, partial [Dongiaceae bacterium]|nr:FtsX-like permease family protein [Dongiaceae bacterium]
LWQIRWRALAVALTIGAGVGIHGGIWMAIASSFHSRDVLFSRMRFADLEVQFLPEDVANLPDLARIPGVRTVERRLVLPGTVSLGGGRRIAGVLVCLERTAPDLNRLEIIGGGPIRAGDLESAVIDRSLGAFHGFRVGDRIRVQVGEKVYDSRIDGVVVSPEYLITTANPDYFVPERGALGAVFTDIARIGDALGFTMVNDVLIGFEPGADPRRVTEAVIERLGRVNIERVIPMQQHFMWKYVQLVMEGFGLYVPSIDAVLGTLSLVLTLITMHRLVSNQRREIGALLALGYRPGQLLCAYLAMGTVLGAAGGAIGTGLAFVFGHLFAGSFSRAVGTPEVIALVQPWLLAGTFALAVVATAVAAALPAWRLLRLS